MRNKITRQILVTNTFMSNCYTTAEITLRYAQVVGPLWVPVPQGEMFPTSFYVKYSLRKHTLSIIIIIIIIIIRNV